MNFGQITPLSDEGPPYQLHLYKKGNKKTRVMKFAHSLKFNSVPEWSEYYVSYSSLKKIIYQIEKVEAEERAKGLEAPKKSDETVGASPAQSNDSLPLVNRNARTSAQLEALFVQSLNEDVSKVTQFFLAKYAEFAGNFKQFYDEYSTLCVEEEAVIEEGQVSEKVASDQSYEREKKKDEFRSKSIQMYIDLCSLKDYLELNYTGFSKILKKHDKVTCYKLKSSIMANVSEALNFKESDSLKNLIDQAESLHARVLFQGRHNLAAAELRHYLKDEIIYERNSIWKDMIERERRTSTLLSLPKYEKAPVKKAGIWKTFRQPILLSLSSILFIILLAVPIFKDRAIGNCFALFVYMSLLWAFEVFPLFVPAMAVPFLIVVLGVLKKDGSVLGAPEAAKHIFSVMFSQTIMLLLGGFSLAGALSKYNIAKSAAVAIISRSGKNPSVILLVIMFVAWFASMWISNVAAPVLCFSIVQPIIKNLESGSKYSKAVIMGIVLAANIGGMASPISSPQNVIAIDRMTNHSPAFGWPQWLAVSIPVCLISLAIGWAVLLFVYRPNSAIKEIHPLRASEEKWNFKHYFIIGVTIVTVALWCCISVLKPYIGEMGILAIFPLICFFGTGILTKEDFNNFLWTVVMLAMGGTAIGEAVKSSGLLNMVGVAISNALAKFSVFQIGLVFCLIILVITTFISHTVGAFIILPIVETVGAKMDPPRAQMLIMLAALTCSAGMGLPVSSFPNMNAVNLEDPSGKNYVNTMDFIKSGIPTSVFVYLLIAILAFGIMLGMGY